MPQKSVETDHSHRLWVETTEQSNLNSALRSMKSFASAHEHCDGVDLWKNTTEKHKKNNWQTFFGCGFIYCFGYFSFNQNDIAFWEISEINRQINKWYWLWKTDPKKAIKQQLNFKYILEGSEQHNNHVEQ